MSTSSRSKLFANSAILVSGTLRVTVKILNIGTCMSKHTV